MIQPITLTFKFWTLKNEVIVEQNNQTILYINQKFWNLKEKILVLDKENGNLNYRTHLISTLLLITLLEA
jgi:hypothetical protein